MSKIYFRRCRLFLFAATAFLAFLLIVKLSEQSRAQHRTEGRSPATKPRSKAKVPVPTRAGKAQQQINADGSITGVPWMGDAGIAETTAEIMSRELSVRAAKSGSRRLIEREPERDHIRINRDHLPQNPEALPGVQWPPLGDGATGRQGDRVMETQSLSLPVSPSPSLSFTAATLTDTGSFPPDAMGAVGPTQFLMAVNGRIRVFSKTTGAKGELDADIDSFFSSVRGGDITTDPQVRYDRLSGRWFIVIINVAAANNRIMLAVSDGATINSATVWTFYYFQQNLVTPSGDNGCFADYPGLGVDANALYIGVNQFCNRAFGNTTGYVIRKSSVLSGGQIVVSAFRGLIDTAGNTLTNGIFSPHGVDNDDPNAAEGYFIGTDANSFGRLVLRRVSNAGGVPVLSPNVYINVLATSTPITVRHKGNINGVNGQLDAIDDRLLSARLRQGSLWAAHNIAVNNTGVIEAPRTRNAARWYEVVDLNTAAPRLQQAGTLFAPTETNTEDERSYWMPSLTVSGQGHMLLGFNTAGTTEYINAALAVRWATDPLGELQPPQLFTASPAPYNPSSNSGNQQGRRRWGDYSFTSIDPCDDMTMWTIQQFCDAANSYGLRVAKIAAPPPAIPAAANPPSVAAGLASVNVTITGLSANGAGFYDPGEGFGCRLRAAINGATGSVTVNSVNYVNPTTLLLNLSTVNASAGAKNIIITNPDGQIATGSNLLTVGNCAYKVTANNQNFAASGGVGTISVETASACGWTAVSNGGNSSFITINFGSVGSGTGTVNFTVAPTSGPTRTGSILVAGQTVSIMQNAGGGCSYVLSPPSKNFPSAGGTSSFNVAAAPECSWAAATSNPFISILFSSAGQGNGNVNFTVAPNDQPVSRTGNINVGGQIFTVTQDAPPFEIAVDDGAFETASGISTGGVSYRVNRLTPGFYPATMNAVAIFFPDNGSVKAGDSFAVILGTNPDGDANIDGTSFQTVQAQVQELGAFNVVAMPPLTIGQGDFIVGLQLNQSANVFPFALDTTTPRNRSYRSLDGVSFAPVESVGANGNYGIRARLVRPPKLIVGAGASLAVESCLPANRSIDPGETVTVNLSLGNNGSSSTQNLTATLVTSRNVITTEQVKSYGALAPSAPAVTRQFTFTASGACGAIIPVTLSLKDGSEDLGTVSFNFTLGAVAATARTFSYAGGALNIPDGDARGVSVPLTISGFAGNLADLNFRVDGTDCTANAGATGVGLDHTWVGDLTLRLTSPAGTVVTIINRAGGGGNNGKNFCQTILDDDAANAISINSVASNGAPYTGTFKPANPLSAFDGENPNGTWTLTVIDEFTGDTGNLRAFSLLLTGFACCSTGCLDATAMSASSGAVGSQVTITGTGFNGVTAVKFGDVAAAFSISSNTSITATVPAGARIAPIILSKPGCVDAQTLAFSAFPVVTLTPPALTATLGVLTAMRVNLSYPPSNGTTVTLTASNSLLATVPASVLIPAGSAAADFQVNGIAAGGPVTITAKLPANLGGGSASATINVVARTISVISAAASIGRSAAVPIVLESKGDETVISFSLSFDPALLANPQPVAGSDAAGAQFNPNFSQASQGRIGVTISQPPGQKFAAGLRQIAVVNFDLPATAQAVTAAITFSDQPVARAVSNANGAPIIAQFVGGSVRIGQGYEADVAPRPAGNNSGSVTIIDWVQIGRFVAGLDTAASASEFRRADCAPRDSLGDGKITLIDWVQAGRYVAGLDAPVVAGGPTELSAAIPDAKSQISDFSSNGAEPVSGRRLKAKASGNLLAIHLTATGNENALGFSVSFDPEQWRFVAARAGRHAQHATVIVNSTQTAQGRIGVLLALPNGQTLRAGERETVILQFAPRRRSALLNAKFEDAPIAPSVVDAAARELTIRHRN